MSHSLYELLKLNLLIIFGVKQQIASNQYTLGLI